MRHLFLCREYPPASYAPGGIGSYVANMARALALAGEAVYVIAEQWHGAPRPVELSLDGRLVVHRVPGDRAVDREGVATSDADVRLLCRAGFRALGWNWNAARLAEWLVEHESIDVIEGQEWEAPLHFFLQRRALGLGPARTPPCIVHLHSPSALIWEANGWPAGHPTLVAMRRMEEHCLATADALLAPSRFLAEQLTARFALGPGAIAVIPYPLPVHEAATAPSAARNALPHAPTSTVVYAGRIEARKGVLEFVEAAVTVAREHADVAFDFVGADVRAPDGRSTLARVRALVPPELASRFRFHGLVSRAEVRERMRRARFAVVPSRWDNLPNTCLEAMAAGVPLLVSPNGGMAELVEDGVSGWVAPACSVPALAATLRRALATPDAERERMGRTAREVVHARCDPDTVVRQQLALRHEVVRRGAARPPRSLLPEPRVVCVEGGPASIVPRAVEAARRDPSAVLLVTAAGVVIEPAGVALAARLLVTDASVGVCTGWIAADGDAWVSPGPASPYQWLANEAWPVALLRASTLLDAAPHVDGLADGEAWWGLVNAILATGLTGVSIPARIARMPRGQRAAPVVSPDLASRDRLHAWMRQRFPEQGAQLEGTLASLAPWPLVDATGGITADRWTGIDAAEAWRLPVRDKLALAVALLRRPARLLGWLRTRVVDRSGLGG